MSFESIWYSLSYFSRSLVRSEDLYGDLEEYEWHDVEVPTPTSLLEGVIHQAWRADVSDEEMQKLQALKEALTGVSREDFLSLILSEREEEFALRHLRDLLTRATEDVAGETSKLLSQTASTGTRFEERAFMELRIALELADQIKRDLGQMRRVR